MPDNRDGALGPERNIPGPNISVPISRCCPADPAFTMIGPQPTAGGPELASIGGTAADPAAAPRAPEDTDRPVVEIDQVSKRFGDFVAVNGADFTAAAGEFFALLGPSGCGKTTLLRMIAGFDTPTSGTIRLQGTDVSDVYKRQPG